jgi:lipopolysaccharide/colanic/teichoic acid biosynthesis glycosyltransferase
MKRTFDFLAASIALTLLSPLLAAIAVAIWLDDRRSPFFLALRVARGGGDFRMVKFRTMIPDAWKSGVNSTASSDSRITRVGKWLRKSKLDELPQLWNVVAGDMSLVGPRPQVRADVNLYTSAEFRMLAARPGITDLASIAFADEGEILAGSADPDLLYNQIVRPWKSRLILLYLENRSFLLDLHILLLTALALVSRPRVLRSLSLMIDALDAQRRAAAAFDERNRLPPSLCGGYLEDASDKLRAIASRKMPLEAWPPPGAEAIVERYGAKEASAHA